VTAAGASTRDCEVFIRADGLRVRYGERPALDGVGFEVRAGEVVGLIGPNGAGKTTTLSVLATLLRPETGKAVVGGFDVDREARAARRVLGFVPQTLAIYPTLTARENARFFASLFGLRRREARAAVERALAVVGLEERADDIVATFSGGMQRRLNLACGLLHRPRVLLLDEPTVGVDPQSRERIFTAVREQAESGAAILYSTHYMEEAERLCERVVLIDRGRVIEQGKPAELVRQLGTGMRLELVTRAALPAGWLDGLPGARPQALARGDGATVQRGSIANVLIESFSIATRVLERAAAQGGEVLEFHLHQPDLQDLFLAVTGRELRD
jgi:ABC-2 type transport system ATP-binding protein